MAREIHSIQTYQDRLLKLIPTEVVGVYMALQGVIPAEYAKWGTLVAAGVLFLLTPVYLIRIMGVKRVNQLVVTTLSFGIWVYTLGGPFQHWGWYQGWIGSVLLISWTFAVPLIVNPRTEEQPA